MRRQHAKHARPRVHDPASARDVAANSASNGINLGVIFGWLPHIAAALSAVISVVQFWKLARAWWRKWRKPRRTQRPRHKRRGRK